MGPQERDRFFCFSFSQERKKMIVNKWSDSKSKSRICKINKTITVFHFTSKIHESLWLLIGARYYYFLFIIGICQLNCTVIKLFGRVIKVARKSCVLLFHKNKAIITVNGGVSIQINAWPNNEITWKPVYQENCIIRFISPARNEQRGMTNEQWASN